MREKDNGAAAPVYARPWMETEEAGPALLICKSQLDGELVDVVDEPMY